MFPRSNFKILFFLFFELWLLENKCNRFKPWIIQQLKFPVHKLSEKLKNRNLYLKIYFPPVTGQWQWPSIQYCCPISRQWSIQLASVVQAEIYVYLYNRIIERLRGLDGRGHVKTKLVSFRRRALYENLGK